MGRRTVENRVDQLLIEKEREIKQMESEGNSNKTIQSQTLADTDRRFSLIESRLTNLETAVKAMQKNLKI